MHQRSRSEAGGLADFRTHAAALVAHSRGARVHERTRELAPCASPLSPCAQEAFSLADEILRQGITGISDIVVKPGLINVDFADVRSVMANAGPALMGIGRGFGAHAWSTHGPPRTHAEA